MSDLCASQTFALFQAYGQRSRSGRAASGWRHGVLCEDSVCEGDTVTLKSADFLSSVASRGNRHLPLEHAPPLLVVKALLMVSSFVKKRSKRATFSTDYWLRFNICTPIQKDTLGPLPLVWARFILIYAYNTEIQQ